MTLREAGAWLGRELRPFRALASGIIVYLALRMAFAWLTRSQGLLTPGTLDRRLAVFGLVMVVMRITVLVGVPAFVAYRVTHRLMSRDPPSPADRHLPETLVK